MKKKLKTIMSQLEKKKFTVIRVSKTEFELDNGDIYPHTFELDEDVTVEEFQTILDKSQSTMISHLDNILKDENDEQ